MSKKIFVVGLSREVTFWCTTDLNIEADTEAEAKELALKYSHDLDPSDWTDVFGTEIETYSVDYTSEISEEERDASNDLIIWNRDEE